MKQWDVFLSHASEDKQAVALPLANALRRLGVRVWLDKFELKIGDSLREKIDEGLSNRRFGIVVLSHSFFQKHWTSREVDGLFAKEERGRRLMLPIWHDVSKPDVVRFSPILAGIVSGNTADGIATLSSQLADVIFEPSSTEATATARDFAQLLTTAPAHPRLVEFLSLRTSILSGTFSSSSQVRVMSAVQIAGQTVDFCVGEFQPTRGSYGDWKLILLKEPGDILFTGAETPSPGIVSGVSSICDLRKGISSDLSAARERIPGIKPSFLGVIIAGRRPQPESEIARILRDYNDALVGSQVRTYDWLLDLAQNSERSSYD